MNLTSTKCIYPSVLLLLHMACFKQLFFPTLVHFPKFQGFISGVCTFSVMSKASELPLLPFLAPYSSSVVSSWMLPLHCRFHSYSALSRRLPNTSAFLVASFTTPFLIFSYCLAHKPAETYILASKTLLFFPIYLFSASLMCTFWAPGMLVLAQAFCSY